MTDRRRPADSRAQARYGQARAAAGRSGGLPPRRDEPTGRRIGPLAITPTGVLLAIALVGSLLYLVFAITVRDPSQIPMLVSGAVVLGVVFVAIAVTGLIASWRSSIRGRDGRALGHALVGGLACLAAAGCFAAAIILGMMSQAP
jgi:hypothetical protein